MIAIDFETEAIDGNTTVNPPKPVGVAIQRDGMPGTYLSWGHPTGNNCTYEHARETLAEIWSSNEKLVFHNAGFDTSVAYRHMGVGTLSPNRIHDTMYSVFFYDPYNDLHLKTSAERILGDPPEEQDLLKEWILKNVRPQKPSQWGAHIADACGHVVRPYAIGDVDRTLRLHHHIQKWIENNGVQGAYKREQELFPILRESERKGIRMDVENLNRDLEIYEKALIKCENKLRKIFKTDYLDFDKNDQLCDALEKSGIVKEFPKTPTGRRSTAKAALEASIERKDVKTLLRYRGALAYGLATFLRPWAQLSVADGRLHTTWNQVRSAEGSDSRGTRTGRISASKPNFTNVSNEYEFGDSYDVNALKGLPILPYMRRYLLPEEGHVWLKRDFSSQEVRILAHFEDDKLLQAYNEDPSLDPHEMALQLILSITGIALSRKQTKIIAFGIIYGMGLAKLAQSLGVTIDEARTIKNAYFRAFPGIRTLAEETSRVGRRGEAIHTWGGRVYYAEPQKYVQGQLRSFEYKLLNYLIQGSAADQTKQSIIDWYREASPDCVLMAQVYDEINISVPKEDWKKHMETLRLAMDEDRMDVPFQSEGFMGETWFDLEAA